MHTQTQALFVWLTYVRDRIAPPLSPQSDVIEVVTDVVDEEEGEVAANSSNEFFDLFVSSLTSGPKFASLTAEQQAVASEKVRGMRPHFEAELEELKERRGWGATVTGTDIKEMLPRVMARVARAAA